jgi:hypothetical protein
MGDKEDRNRHAAKLMMKALYPEEAPIDVYTIFLILKRVAHFLFWFAVGGASLFTFIKFLKWAWFSTFIKTWYNPL